MDVTDADYHRPSLLPGFSRITCGKHTEVVVFFRAEPYSMRFTALENTVWSTDGEPFLCDDEEGRKRADVVWEDRDASIGVPGEVLACGVLKWDGCMDIDIGRGGSYRNHFCGRTAASIIGALHDHIYDLGAKHITMWSSDLAT